MRWIEPLETRRKLGRLCMMYTIIHGLVDLNIHNYYSLQFFLGREPSAWAANTCLQVVVCSCFCFPANSILHMRKWNHAFLLLARNGRSLRFPKIFLKKQTRWSNDKTIIQIIELGCWKISWFVSVWYSTSVIAGLFDGELTLQSAIQKTQKLSPQILSFKLLYCIFFFFVITRLLYLSVKQLSLPDLSSI